MKKLTSFQDIQRGKIEDNLRMIRWIVDYYCLSTVKVKNSDICYIEGTCLECWSSTLQQSKTEKMIKEKKNE